MSVFGYKSQLCNKCVCTVQNHLQQCINFRLFLNSWDKYGTEKSSEVTLGT